MSDTINSNQMSNWKTLAPYLAFLLGVLVLMFVIFINKQDITQKSQNSNSTDHPFESTGTPAQPAAQDANAVANNGTAIPAGAPSDPFKAFLEAHKNDPLPPVNAHPAPKTPQEIQAAFKAAVEKDISSANPFAVARDRTIDSK